MAVNGHRFRAEKDKGRRGVGGETLLLRSQALLLSTLCDLEVITPAMPNETHLEGCARAKEYGLSVQSTQGIRV